MSWKQRWQAVAISALLGGSAFAANTLPQLDLQRFNFNPSSNDSLSLEGGDLNDPGTFRFSFAGELATDANLNRGGETKHYELTRKIVTFSGAYTPNNWLQVNFELPFVAFQNGASALQSTNYSLPTQNGTGTPLVGARFGILKQSQGYPLNLAAELKVGLPFGAGSAEARDLRMPLLPTISVGHDFGAYRIDGQVNATFRAQQTMEVLSGDKEDLYTHEMGGGVGISGNIPGVSHLRGEFSTSLAVALKNADVSVQTFAGLRYGLDQSGTEVFLGGGPAFGNLIGTPKLLLVGGMAFGGAGGNHAMEQKAPEPARQVAQVVCEKNAPHEVTQCPNLDDDGDGIANGADKCPFTMGNGVDGCPVKEAPKAVAIVIDTDKDGIPDTDDKCPSVAGPKENNGCPVEAAKPVVADADGDGILDDLDTCPTLKGPADNHGCPADQKQQVVITNDHIQILDKVYFANSSAKIDKKSYRLLDQVAEVIKSHPNIPAVEVSGHTDNRGSAPKNTKLSQARADSVRSYLIEKGVPADKLASKGYGSDKPIDTNLTASGREANRRVEFNFTKSQTVTTQNIPVAAPAPKKKGSKKGKTESAKATTPAAPAPTAGAKDAKAPASAPAKDAPKK